MRVVFLVLPLSLSVHAEDLGELSANPARLSGLSGLFGSSGWFSGQASKINQIDRTNETDQLTPSRQSRLSRSSRPLPHRPNRPDKRDRPVSVLPTAAASELKDAGPGTEPLHVIARIPFLFVSLSVTC